MPAARKPRKALPRKSRKETLAEAIERRLTKPSTRSVLIARNQALELERYAAAVIIDHTRVLVNALVELPPKVLPADAYETTLKLAELLGQSSGIPPPPKRRYTLAYRYDLCQQYETVGYGGRNAFLRAKGIPWRLFERWLQEYRNGRLRKRLDIWLARTHANPEGNPQLALAAEAAYENIRSLHEPAEPIDPALEAVLRW
jgi:hypothetical protein